VQPGQVGHDDAGIGPTNEGCSQRCATQEWQGSVQLWHDSDEPISAGYVRSWHESEVPERDDDVCFRGQSGLNMLAASLSGFDPKATSARLHCCRAN
jgi:hypothetical protein